MSKGKTKELDVDFIGAQGPLTKEEEGLISSFISARKKLSQKRKTRRIIKSKKVNASV